MKIIVDKNFLTKDQKNFIKLHIIYRSVFNLTFNNGIDVCGTHKDHYNNLKHKQLLIYLNDPEDKNTPTVILNKKRNTIIKKTYPEQFKGILFNDEPHYMIFPKVGLRCVLITTFN